jgi:coenzyme F420 hydrogenase subunit beta
LDPTGGTLIEQDLLLVEENVKSPEIEETKTFKDLIKDVHDQGICGQCGGCVSFCFAGDLVAITMGKNGRPIYIDEENCLKCGICFLICPQINILDNEIQEQFEWKLPIGHYKKIVAAKTRNEEVMENCTDGGVVTSILHCLLERNLIDGAIVSQKTGPFGRKPMIATSYDEVLSSAGTRFIGSSQVEELGNFTTYSPTMEALRKLKNMDLLRIAVVGTPCQIHSIRKMQHLGVVPSHVIKYTIGLFCYENFSFDIQDKEKIESRLGIRIDDIEKINIREDFIITLKSGEVKHIPLDEIDDVVRPACFACTDFANDFADISVGGLGSPDGYTTTVIRTEDGMEIYSEAKRHSYIEELLTCADEELKNKYSSNDCLQKIIQYSERKRRRGLEILEKLKVKPFNITH